MEHEQICPNCGQVMEGHFCSEGVYYTCPHCTSISQDSRDINE